MEADTIVQEKCKLIIRGKRKFIDPMLESIYQSITIGNRDR